MRREEGGKSGEVKWFCCFSDARGTKDGEGLWGQECRGLDGWSGSRLFGQWIVMDYSKSASTVPVEIFCIQRKIKSHS